MLKKFMAAAVLMALSSIPAIGDTPAAPADLSPSTPIVTFGGETITRGQYLEVMEGEYGKSVLGKLVVSKIVMDAAEKVGVVPTTEEVGSRLEEIDRRTPQVSAAARQDPAKLAQLKLDLKTDMAMENLRMRGITATDAEVANYYSKVTTQPF